MTRNGDDRRGLETLSGETNEEQIAYYRKPFMVLWAAVQEASAELAEDYGLSQETAQLWVAERMRQVSDSLVDRLAQKAVAHGVSQSNVARAADASPTNARRRFPKLSDSGAQERMLIDDVLDTLE